MALGPEQHVPGLLGFGVDHVTPVEHQQMLLAADPPLQAGMARGQGDAGVANLDHQIDLAEGVLERLLCPSDVARIPLNRRGVDAQRGHQGTTITGQGASWITRAAVLC